MELNLFEEVLLQNGFIEYNEKNEYYTLNDVKCYHCGKLKKDHNNIKDIEHIYKPATYVVFTGQTTDIHDIHKKDRIKNIFNKPENKDGSIIKFLLGSVVMSEGITLKNIKDIHIMDAHLNKSKMIQAIGRGIRNCSHIELSNEYNPYPEVNIYTYCSLLSNNKISSELIMYRHAEIKYFEIKKIETVLKENAIDCPLNYELNKKNESNDFKCSEECLNNKYWNSKQKIYNPVKEDEIDKSTYNEYKFDTQLKYCILKIKELYQLNIYYTIEDIVHYIYDSYNENDKNIFDTYFVYQAIDYFILIDEQDFIDYTEKLKDPFQREGYLIYRGNYYIFQEWGTSELMPLYYRVIPPIINMKSLSLLNYLENSSNKKYLENIKIKSNDFDKTMLYYTNKLENDIVGILKYSNENKDMFKMRHKLKIKNDMGRGKGILNYTGSVCNTYSLQYIKNVCKMLNIDISNTKNRHILCDKIKETLLKLEKYATGSNKKTYIILPINHPNYNFPYNLEDRVEHIKNEINTKLNLSKQYINIIKKENQYQITFSIDNINIKEDDINYLKLLNAIYNKKTNNYEIIIE